MNHIWAILWNKHATADAVCEQYECPNIGDCMDICKWTKPCHGSLANEGWGTGYSSEYIRYASYAEMKRCLGVP